MKKTLIAGALLSFVFAVPAFATEGGQPPKGQGQTFEQRQASILKMLDERIAGLQGAKTCVQEAKSNVDLKACKEKHMAGMREKREEMKQQRGMMGGPKGQ